MIPSRVLVSVALMRRSVITAGLGPAPGRAGGLGGGLGWRGWHAEVAAVWAAGRIRGPTVHALRDGTDGGLDPLASQSGRVHGPIRDSFTHPGASRGGDLFW